MKKILVFTTCLLATLLATTFSANAQDIVKTVVGGGPNGIPGVDANLYYPYETAVDSSGNVYVASEQQDRIFKIDSGGVISVVAGNGVAGYSGDGGPAVNANLYNPHGIAVDTANPANIYIADFNNCLVRKVTGSTGIITTIAGLVTVPASGNPYTTCGYSGNGGAANQARIYGPSGLALDPKTNDLYITEFYNGIVRKVAGGTATGTISLYAGSGGSPTAGNNCGGSSPYGDGASATAGFLCYPQAVSLDTSASPVNAFISESVSGGHCDIREVVGASKDIYQVAGSYAHGCGFTDNVTATSGQLYDPWQTHVSVSGSTTTVQVADYNNARIRQFTLTYSAGAPVPGTITTIAGKGQGGYCGDGGSALNACMSPVGLAYDSSGNYYIGDYGAQRLRKVTKSTGYISTLAGWGPNGGTNTTYSDPVGVLNASGVPALYYPVGVSADPNSSKVYVSGYSGQAVYVWDNATNEVSDFAGSGVAGFAGDGGLAASVGTELYNPAHTAKDSSGNVYIADFNNCVIRQVNPSTGDITTVAGGSAGSKNGCGYTGDSGTAVNAQFNGIYALAIDSANNIYVADYYNCAIRKIDGSSSIVSTIAGGLGCGFTGDNGPATKAKIYYPAGIAVDGAGNIYFSDYQNQRVREIVALTGNIQTIAGTGNAGYNGDGQATASNLYYPVGVAADMNGNVFIADQDNYILRWVTPTGQMLTFAGTPSSAGFSGDGGPALSAKFYQPNGIAQDNKGNFYTADYNNFRIRQVSAFAGYGLSTNHITFETQPVGTSSEFQALAISAIGPTMISSIKASSGFSEIDDCVGGIVLNAGETCEVDIYFKPTTGQTYNGTLTINSNAFLPGNPNTVALTGVGGGLSITGNLDYYSVPVNTVKYNTFTLHNNGPALTIDKTVLAFPSGFYFGTTSTCPRTGTIPANSTCTIALNFSPHYVGEQDNTVVIQSSDPASPLLFQPYGNGTAVKLSTYAINFGTIAHGTKATQNITVSNVSSAPYTLSTKITGTGFSILTTGNTCGSTVVAGASCVVPIQYAPATAGSYSGSVTFTTNGGSSPSVTLTGVAN